MIPSAWKSLDQGKSWGNLNVEQNQEKRNKFPLLNSAFGMFLQLLRDWQGDPANAKKQKEAEVESLL